MAFLSSLNISGSALTAQRLRMDVISENIANASTTRTEKGGPYRRKMVVLEPAGQSSFRRMMEDHMNSGEQAAGGVQVAQILEDQSPFTPVYDPANPDANDQGYVMMPNVDPTKETLDMMDATTSYNANLTAFNAVKGMAAKALEMGR
jgi:flagellar basal-body rod protein FlgC